MINSKKGMERFLQKRRFNKILPFIKGDTLLDHGGNKGELKEFVTQEYTLCNKDISILGDRTFDTIVSLAVIEHLWADKVYDLFNTFNKHLNYGGRVIITTPQVWSHPILNIMSRIGITDRENILEHKHYWSKQELFNLAESVGFKVIHYEKFQFIFNQIIVLEK